MNGGVLPAGGILDQPAVWHLLHLVRRQRPGTSAAAAAVHTGVDFLTVVALTRGDPPMMDLVDRWDPRRPASVDVTGPDQLPHVGLRLSHAGVVWLDRNPAQHTLLYLAGAGGRAHLSTLAGSDVGDVAALERLRAAGAVTVRHTTGHTFTTVTADVLPECRNIVVALTPFGVDITGPQWNAA